MRVKVSIILATMFLSQLVISCCDCPAPVSYENIYTDVSITPYDISGFNTEPVTDTVYKNAFGLGIAVNFYTELYAGGSNSLSAFGFSSAMALDCDCPDNEYLYPDPISHMNIYMDDLQNDQKTDVTHCFKIHSYAGDLISLEEFFKERESWHDGFQIELDSYDLIPNSVIFIAEVILESGTIFSNQTDIINFYNQ